MHHGPLNPITRPASGRRRHAPPTSLPPSTPPQRRCPGRHLAWLGLASSTPPAPAALLDAAALTPLPRLPSSTRLPKHCHRKLLYLQRLGLTVENRPYVRRISFDSQIPQKIGHSAENNLFLTGFPYFQLLLAVKNPSCQQYCSVPSKGRTVEYNDRRQFLVKGCFSTIEGPTHFNVITASKVNK
jgi:hypothetical protein